jgi:hypothetical protein
MNNMPAGIAAMCFLIAFVGAYQDNGKLAIIAGGLALLFLFIASRQERKN